MGHELKELESVLQLGDVKPFAVMRNAEVNNLDDMEGHGTKKYSFENGQITTATEYIGERQDQMQELNESGYIPRPLGRTN